MLGSQTEEVCRYFSAFPILEKPVHDTLEHKPQLLSQLLCVACKNCLLKILARI